jgi:uncharacterized protein YndB with AHSA1/START domain
MAQRKNSSTRPASSPTLRLTRIFQAPRALVFAAWTKPEHLKRWSAPHGFTITRSEGDLRPGGTWRASMRGPDGVDLHLSGKYLEIVPNELLVFTHAWEDESGTREQETTVTVRFADHGRKTKVTFEQGPFDSPQSRDGHQGGWSECLERLGDLLETLQAWPRTVSAAKTNSRERVAAGKGK